MKNIVNALRSVDSQISVNKNWMDTSKFDVKATCVVEESSIQSYLDNVEALGGTWKVMHNRKGLVRVRIDFKKVESDGEFIMAVKIINRHWFESKFINDRNALEEYCLDILSVSSK